MFAVLTLSPLTAAHAGVFEYVTGEAGLLPPGTDDRPWNEVLEELRNHAYPDPPEGTKGVERSHTHTLSNGHEATFFYYVPKSYTPGTATPLMITLHGAAMLEEPERGRGGYKRWQEWAEQTGAIVAAPSCTIYNVWWTPEGEEHILETLRYLGARYHLDRNRVYLSGFSDGATATYNLGTRFAGLWAGCIAWNGSIRVLPSADHLPVFTQNAAMVPWRAVHGEKDQLYPGAEQKWPMKRLERTGADLTWDVFDGIGHEGQKTFARDKDFIYPWIGGHTRNPLPEKVDWTVLEPGRYGRAFWVRVTALSTREHDPWEKQPDLTWPAEPGDTEHPILGISGADQYEDFVRDTTKPGVLLRRILTGSGADEAGLLPGDRITHLAGREVRTTEQLGKLLQELVTPGDTVEVTIIRNGEPNFPLNLDVPYRPQTFDLPDHTQAGRLEARREGNTIHTRSRKVGRFELLISPDVFDLSQEIVVNFKGAEKFRAKAEPSTRVMLEEMRDRLGDTTTPYVARIPILVDPAAAPEGEQGTPAGKDQP